MAARTRSQFWFNVVVIVESTTAACSVRRRDERMPTSTVTNTLQSHATPTRANNTVIVQKGPTYAVWKTPQKELITPLKPSHTPFRPNKVLHKQKSVKTSSDFCVEKTHCSAIPRQATRGPLLCVYIRQFHVGFLSEIVNNGNWVGAAAFCCFAACDAVCDHCTSWS